MGGATPKTRVRTCEVHHGETLLCAPRVTAEVHVLAEQLDRRRARQGHLGGGLGRAALQTLGDGDGILAIRREDDLLRDGIDVGLVDFHCLGLVVADQRLDRRRGVHDRRRHGSGNPAPTRVRFAFFSRRRARRSGRDASSARASCKTERERYPRGARVRFLGKARPVRRARESLLVTMTPSAVTPFRQIVSAGFVCDNAPKNLAMRWHAVFFLRLFACAAVVPERTRWHLARIFLSKVSRLILRSRKNIGRAGSNPAPIDRRFHRVPPIDHDRLGRSILP